MFSSSASTIKCKNRLHTATPLQKKTRAQQFNSSWVEWVACEHFIMRQMGKCCAKLHTFQLRQSGWNRVCDVYVCGYAWFSSLS